MPNLDNQHEIVAYIKDNPVAIVGTISEQGLPHGAAVYVCAISPKQLYFVTKTQTQKFKDITNNPNISLTIVNQTENSSLQAGGHARNVDDALVIEEVMAKMLEIHSHDSDPMPPISKLRAGAYKVVEIDLDYARLAQYKFKSIGSPSIFKEA